MAEERVRSKARGGARPTGTNTGSSQRRTPRRAPREPQLSRTRSPGQQWVATTSGWLGISSTRRAAVLAIVVCAIALTVAVPLRNYVAQRQELAAVEQQQRDLAVEVAALQAERDRLSDPAQIEALARSRFGYAMPGEVPYIVQLPPAPAAPPPTDAEKGIPWFSTLWHEVTAGSP
jgi:cell division protein FtsB